MLRHIAFVVGLLSAFHASSAQAGIAYFLVGERPGMEVHGDSFVVGLTDPGHISHARDLITLGPDIAGAPILFAHIVPGADGINRDLLSPTQTEWSWHIDQVHGFADMGIELVDGWPTYVEQDVPGWIANTQGEIGFWSYTVVRELPNYPTDTPSVPLPPAVWIGGIMLGAIVVKQWARKPAVDGM